MKYKIINQPMVMRSGRISYDLVFDIYDEKGKIDVGATNTLFALIFGEYDGYDIENIFYDYRTGEPIDNDLQESDLVDITVFKDRIRYSDAIAKNTGNYYYEGWITKHDLLHIAKKFYKLKKSYQKGKGYVDATDEVYDTELTYD